MSVVWTNFPGAIGSYDKKSLLDGVKCSFASKSKIQEVVSDETRPRGRRFHTVSRKKLFRIYQF